MSVYLDRKAQTKYLRKRGIKIGDSTLANMASKGKGPRFAVINNRAVSTEEWLDAWMEEEASVTPLRRREKAAARASAEAASA